MAKNKKQIEEKQICERCGYEDDSGIEMEETHDGEPLCDRCFGDYEEEDSQT